VSGAAQPAHAWGACLWGALVWGRCVAARGQSPQEGAAGRQPAVLRAPLACVFAAGMRAWGTAAAHTTRPVPCSHICMELAEPRETLLMQLPCGHTFCAPCITQWLAQNHTCPTCRWEFDQGETRVKRPSSHSGPR